jgi:hypothetical protein
MSNEVCPSAGCPVCGELREVVEFRQPERIYYTYVCTNKTCPKCYYSTEVIYTKEYEETEEWKEEKEWEKWVKAQCSNEEEENETT